MWIALLAHRFVRLAVTAIAMTLAVTTIVSAQREATYEIVSSFYLEFQDGRAPSSLRQASDGTFYGTTSAGGAFDMGILFRMDAAGVVTQLHSFSGGIDGARPFALVRALDGQFYGMTLQGGEFEHGTLFRFTPGGGLTTLHAFSQADRSPADLFAASDGNVYGLTGRGEFDPSTIFLIEPGGGVATIHSFDRTTDGFGMRSLIKGSDGRFYITTEFGGEAGHGTVTAIDDAGTRVILHSFRGRLRDDGEGPAGLIQGRDGRLYGTTLRGGSGEYPSGTVYSLDLDRRLPGPA